jgi:signal transduction histidine kinase
MKREYSRRYRLALLAYLKQYPEGRLEQAHGLGERALSGGLQTLEIAKLHEQILVTEVLPGRSPSERTTLIKRAGTFFTAAITPVEKIHLGTQEATMHLNQIVEMLSERTVELAAANLELGQEIIQRKAAEEALKKSESHFAEQLERSNRLQEEARRLSREILSAQEDERKKISRELHDVIAQTLTSINIRLASLKKGVALNTKGIDRTIARTQSLVVRSVDLVHQFARELRPAVLDDLGLVPALRSFISTFTEQTGVQARLSAYRGVEEIDINRRTALFRVAQEALSNVARHAKASLVVVTIQKLADCISMKIKDDGQSFQVQSALLAPTRKRLGLLGMRERMEMVGGRFYVESAPGKGTTVTAQIPNGRQARGRSVTG